MAIVIGVAWYDPNEWIQLRAVVPDAIAIPAGGERSALLDQIGPSGAFTCPLLPEHFAEPGQTRTQRIPWVVPAAPGTYSAVGGLRRGDGLGNLSAPVQFVVQ